MKTKGIKWSALVCCDLAQGVWSTLPNNEQMLNQAFRESRNVLLVFSVKESGKFQGKGTFAQTFFLLKSRVEARSWSCSLGTQVIHCCTISCRFCTHEVRVKTGWPHCQLGVTQWNEPLCTRRCVQNRLDNQVCT